MDFGSPCCMVGKCLYLSEADLILKPKTNVIIYNWGYYWDQHVMTGVGMEYRISYLTMCSYNDHYIVLGSRMAREGCLVRTCSTDGTSMPRTNYIGPSILFNYGRKYQISYQPMESYNGHYLVIGSRMVRELSLLRKC